MFRLIDQWILVRLKAQQILHLSTAETTLPIRQAKSSFNIVDIDNSNCWYQQCYLLISTIGIVDNTNINCQYWQLVFLRSCMTELSISLTYLYCRYRQLSTIWLLISTIRIVNMINAQWQQYQVWISTNNCGYRQFKL